MRILVVEDDLEAANYVVKGLRETNHLVDHAADGEQGLLQALGGGYDVLIVDRMLPERDGLSLISELRRTARYHSNPHTFSAWRSGRSGEGPKSGRR